MFKLSQGILKAFDFKYSEGDLEILNFCLILSIPGLAKALAFISIAYPTVLRSNKYSFLEAELSIKLTT